MYDAASKLFEFLARRAGPLHDDLHRAESMRLYFCGYHLTRKPEAEP